MEIQFRFGFGNICILNIVVLFLKSAFHTPLTYLEVHLVPCIRLVSENDFKRSKPEPYFFIEIIIRSFTTLNLDFAHLKT